jgi:hypothetical protein
MIGSKHVGILKHPGYNGGGGGGGAPAPLPMAPSFRRDTPNAPVAPTAPTAPVYGTSPLLSAYRPQRATFDDLSRASNAYMQFGQQAQDFGRARSGYVQQYKQYARDVDAYNAAADAHNSAYGSGYTGYTPASRIQAQQIINTPYPQQAQATSPAVVGKGARP